MRLARYRLRALAFGWAPLLALLALTQAAQAQRLWPLILPEQRTITVRDPAQLRQTPPPDTAPPPTVSQPQGDLPALEMSLDDVIRISLGNSQVVRVLAGVTAVSSGSTVYDAAISNTTIDQARGRFDPVLTAQNLWNRSETPTAVIDPLDPLNAQIAGIRADNYTLNFGIQQTNVAGGTLSYSIFQNPTRFQPGVFPLNPQTTPQMGLGYTQPMLAGGGIAANIAPIVIARIETERSYFQFKGSMQDMVRGVIEAYWNVVFARTDVWARQQQAAQLEQAYERTDARFRVQMADAADVAQTRVAWENARATLIASEANMLQREAILLNILGLPPTFPQRFVPVTSPNNDRLQPEWNAVLTLASQRRPDIVELKLIIEADEQQVIRANNQARPQADAILNYDWNGLFGRTPAGQILNTQPGQFTGWTMGVNFAVPLGLRAGRAVLRQRELIVARDQANLQQGLHATSHALAQNMRNLAHSYEQYLAYKAVREAARINMTQQLAEYYTGRAIFLNVLQAVSDWGNAVSNEANALTTYNTELANLERETGTILETHGIRFVEERFGAIGPLGRIAAPQLYPQRLPPTVNTPIYMRGDTPAENWFDLRSPLSRRVPPIDDMPGLLEDPTEPEAVPTPPVNPLFPGPPVETFDPQRPRP